MEEFVYYRYPFIGDLARVRVLDRAVRNGVKKVRILFSSGIDLWVPETRVSEG